MKVKDGAGWFQKLWKDLAPQKDDNRSIPY